MKLSRALWRATAVGMSLLVLSAGIALAVDLKVDASVAMGQQTSVSIGSTLVGGTSGSWNVRVYTQGGGSSVSYPFSTSIDGTTGIVSGAAEGDITGAGESLGYTSLVSYTLPCDLGDVSGTVTFRGPASLADSAETATAALNGTVTSLDASCSTPSDTTPPSLSLPADITAEATSASGAVVTYSASASDLVDGPVAISCSPVSGSTFALGSTTVNCSATDAALNTANGSFSVTVSYGWHGFDRPIDNPGSGPVLVFNTAKAGQAIPVKFSLSGNMGLGIWALSGPPSSVRVVFPAGSNTDPIEDYATLTAGQSALQYDATTDTYTYVWKTDKAWAGTARKLVVKLADGTEHAAYFNFTK